MLNSTQILLPHFVSVQALDSTQVLRLIKRAEFFKNHGQKPEFGREINVANLFFEDSTRTKTSFIMAEKKLGLEVFPFTAANSSVNKGETLYDTLLTLSAIGIDLAVIRHPQNDYYAPLLDQSDSQLDIGILNAGDGSGQHPSQSLLDLMTIHEEFGQFAGLKVAIVGDLKNSRVARSNMQLLKKLGAQIFFSGPKEWFTAEFAEYGQYLPVDELVTQVDVMMLLRVQHERHTDIKEEASFEPRKYHLRYGLTKERYQKMLPHAIIMHPGPINRDVELAGELVEAPRSRFVAQMQNGVFMRMAMLEAVILGRKLGGQNS
ncbi:aspartate carbamoyltransferase [Ligilactobacillus salitolerans]|uniref:Aspartate carbamoyltransferase n=1 Tax=Ligilactobacillus salitolerans TaxID=1808352 RepID=A0A401IUZ7_9LACO|nr:aspartate carbamoyltransferase catalytic subunit [Ligilactobacillus salitolerans]GBG95352.1 aspartate carbamoyltransferase [Ligilactobacillus salitolerans]